MGLIDKSKSYLYDKYIYIYIYINKCLLGRALYVVLVVSRMEPQFDPATPPKPIYLNYIYICMVAIIVRSETCSITSTYPSTSPLRSIGTKKTQMHLVRRHCYQLLTCGNMPGLNLFLVSFGVPSQMVIFNLIPLYQCKLHPAKGLLSLLESDI